MGHRVTAKILFVDIETSPNKVWTFGLKNQFIGVDQIIEPTRMLCFAARWYGHGDHAFVYSEWDHGHKRMVQAAHKLLTEADIVVHYNGEKFDERRMNQEFASAGMTPPAPFQSIDLWKTINQRFDLPSQKLTYALRHFGLEDKLQTGGFSLWARVMEGDPAAQTKMANYNAQDVDIMIPLYEKLRPWMKAHPNLNLYEPDVSLAGHTCPRCGSLNLQRRGFRRTAISKYQRYQCNDCGGWSTSGGRVDGSDVR